MNNEERVEAAKSYLLTQFQNGLCLEFSQLSHGPSLAWTSACIGSTLAEFKAAPPETLNAILKLQWDCGGWSYNQNSVPDSDSTLRVLQFLSKIGFHDQAIIDRAEKFVIAHQQQDGGIATYLPVYLEKMGYQAGGWTVSHSCVTALAINVITNITAKQKAEKYMSKLLNSGDYHAYWWNTPWYVLYESRRLQAEPISADSVEMSLVLLLKAKLKIADQKLLNKLASLQKDDGSFPSSHTFRIPRPAQFLSDISGTEETISDKNRIFSTAAACIAINRQKALVN